MFFSGRAGRADIIQHCPPAAAELDALLRECDVPGELVEEECIQQRMDLDYHLRDVVAAAPEEYVRDRQMWPEWRQSPYSNMFPVFKTSGDPFVVFTICREPSSELVVTALHFGHHSPSIGFYQRLRLEVIEPRIAALASGAAIRDRRS